MMIQESGEMYLETILIISKKNITVRSLDVAEYMGYSKPSVSRAMSILKKHGYIEIDKNGFITLLEPGKQLAEKIYERHLIITNVLTSLGVNPLTAELDACKIEHDLSDESFQAIKKASMK